MRCGGAEWRRRAAGRQRAQSTVETMLTFLLVLLVLELVVTVAFWAHAQNVATAAAQEAARAASAQGGDLDHGLAVGQRLLQAGLGSTSSHVRLDGREDATSVMVTVTGSWPLALGTELEVGLPLASEARVLKDRWQP